MAALPLIRVQPAEFQFAEARAGYTSQLRLTSLQSQAVGFKLKTNAPHKFLVKPVVWALTEQGMTVDVVVRSTTPITDADRFLIQTVALAPDEAACLDSAKWRTLDPARIMEDLIHCTMGHRRSSVSSVSSHSSDSQPESSPLLAITHTARSAATPAGGPRQTASEKADRRLADGLASRIYGMLPGIDVADFSWTEFALFAAACFVLGFLLPLLRSTLL